MSTEMISTPVSPRGLKRPKVEKEDIKVRQHVIPDFGTFCTWVLDYEASLHDGQIPYVPKTPERVKKRSLSPLDSEGNSVGSGPDSDLSPRETKPKKERLNISYDTDDDWDLVTCFCHKPFAGRPMIECNACETWIHLSCAKIRKSNVPDIYICSHCKDSQFSGRKSFRQREPKKQFKEIYSPNTKSNSS